MDNMKKLILGTLLIIVLVAVSIPLMAWNHPERMAQVRLACLDSVGVLIAAVIFAVIYVLIDFLVYVFWNILKRGVK